MSTINQLENAILCFQKGRYRESKVLFELVRVASPELLIVQVYLAQLAVLEGKGAEWVSPMTELVTHIPFSDEAYHVLGMCLQQAKQLPQAAEAFHTALALVSLQGDQDNDLRLSTPPAESFSIDQGEALLWQTLALLKQHGVHAFASAGTLLGIERDGHLLAQDKDLDIGVDWLQMNTAIAALEANGWQEASRSYDLMNPRCFKHSKTNITLDVCGFGTDTQTGEAISGLWMEGVPFHWNRITYFPKIALSERNSPAGKVWHLTSPEKVLSALYGEHWTIPDADFDTIVCAHNLRHFSWLAYCYGYARLYAQWRRGNVGKALRIVHVLLSHNPQDTMLKHIEVQLLESISESGAKRVLALGFFDLFHQGHLNYLNFAGKQGAYLIVGVAPDHFSVTGKGYPPTIDQTQRCCLVEALEVVNEVHIVAAPMAQTQAAVEWICSLNVDVVVCGDEWQGSKKWERLTEALSEHSIDVVYAPKTEGVSTSLIKERIQGG